MRRRHLVNDSKWLKKCDGSEGRFCEEANSFLANLRLAIENLYKHYHSSNTAQLKETAKQIKLEAHHLEMFGVAEKAREIETLAMSGQKRYLQMLLLQLEKQYQVLRGELTSRHSGMKKAA